MAVAWEMVRMGEAWGQPGVNCLDMGVKTHWFMGTVGARSWGRGGGMWMWMWTHMLHGVSAG